MGLILDPSVLIAAERKGKNARQILTDIAGRAAGEDVALSVVTVMELMHGAARADSAERRSLRREFVNQLVTALPIHLVTLAVALRAGRSTAKTGRGVFPLLLPTC